jgi:hypothetical protein
MTEPKKPRKPEPPGASTERSAELRARRAAQGITELRGLYAPTTQHAAIKAAVREMIEGKKK